MNKKVTYRWSNGEYYAVTRVFDKVDNIAMM